MSKNSSRTSVAENAISKLQGSTFSYQGQQVETSGSTLKCMPQAKQHYYWSTFCSITSLNIFIFKIKKEIL